jgi:hypothetical protein
MRTSIPQDLFDCGNSRKVTRGGDHHFSSDRGVGLFTIEGDRTWTSKLYRCGDVGVSTSRKSRFIRSWSPASRSCRSTFQPEGRRVTRLTMHRARLAVGVVPGRPWLQRREIRQVLAARRSCHVLGTRSGRGVITAGGPPGPGPNPRCGSSCAGAPGPADQPHRPVRIRLIRISRVMPALAPLIATGVNG